MNTAFQHFVGLVFALVVSRIGWSMAKTPEKAYRILSLGQQPNVKFFIAFLRAVGWCFLVVFGAGAIVYLLLIPMDFMRAR